VIDADPQGTASTLLGVDIWSLNETMYDVMTGKIALTNLIRETEIKGLYIAPTNNTSLTQRIIWTSILRAAISSSRRSRSWRGSIT